MHMQRKPAGNESGGDSGTMSDTSDGMRGFDADAKSDSLSEQSRMQTPRPRASSVDRSEGRFGRPGDADDEFSYNQYWRLPMRHDASDSDSDSDDADTFEGTDGNTSDATVKTI